MSRVALLLPLLLAAPLAGCGGRGSLEPTAGQPLPVAAYGGEAPQTADQLLTPQPEARPEIASELLKKSQPRESDRFDLPPPD